MTPRCLIVSLLVCCVAVPASAATIVVNSTADENDSTPANGNCTLREAVLSANGNLAVDACTAGEAAPTVDVIEIPAGVFVLTLAETGNAAGGSLDLTEDVDLIGRGSGYTVIDCDGGQALQAAFEVPSGSTVEVSDLWVRGGHSSFNGISNEGNMTLSKCRIAHNHGRGIGNWGIMTVSESTISHNYASTSGSGVYNQGVFTLEDSSVTNNTGGGGGISNVSHLTVIRSTVSRNERMGIGGIGLIEILNSTISGNDAGSLTAGGVSINLDGTLVVNNSTITGNNSPYGSGLFVQPNAFAQIQNTIIAGNAGSPDCYISGTLLSTGGNIEGPGSSCGFTDPTDQVAVPLVDLALGPLLNHSGANKIHGLLPGSVAIDAGVSTGPIHGCPGDDQRGHLRTDGLCDVGAVEVQPGEDMSHIFADGFESGDTAAWSDSYP
jgi:CSLREA domain-containing protein